MGPMISDRIAHQGRNNATCPVVLRSGDMTLPVSLPSFRIAAITCFALATAGCEHSRSQSPSSVGSNSMAVSSAVTGSATAVAASNNELVPAGLHATNANIIAVAKELKAQADPVALAAASKELVKNARSIISGTTRDEVRRMVVIANEAAGFNPTDAQVATQVDEHQEHLLEEVFVAMQHVLGAPVVDYCWVLAEDDAQDRSHRRLAFMVLSELGDSHATADDTTRYQALLGLLGPAPDVNPASRSGSKVANSTEVVGAMKHEIRSCYNTTPNTFEGTLRIHLAIGLDGKVRRVSVSPQPRAVGDAASLVACIEPVLRQAAFDQPSKGSAVVSFATTFVRQQP